MAGSYNRVILVGNLTRDPEIRYTQSGKAVTKFTLAVNNPRNKEETTFVDIVAWDRLGETCNTYLKKGTNTLVLAGTCSAPVEVSPSRISGVWTPIAGIARLTGTATG